MSAKTLEQRVADMERRLQALEKIVREDVPSDEVWNELLERVGFCERGVESLGYEE